MTETTQREQAVRRHWFNDLPHDEQDAILKPRFDEQHPTNDDVRGAAADYDEMLERFRADTHDESTDEELQRSKREAFRKGRFPEMIVVKGNS